MPDVTFTVSTNFLTRARADIVIENPSLTGQTQAQLNEAARQRFKRLIKQWMVTVESNNAVQTAAAGITEPSDADIA